MLRAKTSTCQGEGGVQFSWRRTSMVSIADVLKLWGRVEKADDKLNDLISIDLAWTLVFTFLVMAIFETVQVIRLFWYKYQKMGYHFAFLILCLVWTILRILWFVIPPGVDIPCFFQTAIFWLPISFQFATFSLLVVFFFHVRFKVHRTWNEMKKRILWGTYAAANISSLVFNIVLVACVCQFEQYTAYWNPLHPLQTSALFIILDVFLLYSAIALTRLDIHSMQLPFHHNGKAKTLSFVVIIVFIDATRSIYDILATFDLVSLTVSSSGVSWESFVLTLLWEVAPTAAVVLFFTIKKTVSTASSLDDSMISPVGGVADGRGERGYALLPSAHSSDSATPVQVPPHNAGLASTNATATNLEQSLGNASSFYGTSPMIASLGGTSVGGSASNSYSRRDLGGPRQFQIPGVRPLRFGTPNETGQYQSPFFPSMVNPRTSEGDNVPKQYM
jgi:hypothetical protein